MLNKIRLLTPGPTPIPEGVRLALARDMIHHRKGEFKEKMNNAQAQLRILFGTEGPVLPLACSGTGAMTAAVYSLFSPGDKVLVVEGGKFGERWRKIAESRGLALVTLEVEWGKAVSPAKVLEALEWDSEIRGVLIQQCETSTGVQNPIRKLASLMAGREPLLVVDGVSAVGIAPCPMDAWGIDCLLTGSQKGLMLPPGLALIALSPRAWQIAERIEPGCFYFNLPKERHNVLKGETQFTTPVNLILGLAASLDLLLKDGLEAVYRKQWAMTSLVRAGAQAMGLKLLAQDNFAWGVTSINMPDGVDAKKVLQVAEDRYSVYMAAGQDHLANRIVRFGHMGWVDWGDCLAGLYALRQGILEFDQALPEGDYLGAAMRAYELALKEPFPDE